MRKVLVKLVLKSQTATTDTGTRPREEAMTTAALIDMPYQIQRTEDDLTIILTADAADHPALPRDEVNDLCEGRQGRITVDAQAVPQVNSVLIGWLVRLAAAAGPGRVVITNLAPRVRAMFLRMRLDQLIVML